METLLLFVLLIKAIQSVPLHIDNHCDVNVNNSYGDTAPICAAGNSHSECVKLLIDNHGDVNVNDTDGETALFLCTS
jgi:ankyrin repeat protein